MPFPPLFILFPGYDVLVKIFIVSSESIKYLIKINVINIIHIIIINISLIENLYISLFLYIIHTPIAKKIYPNAIIKGG